MATRANLEAILVKRAGGIMAVTSMAVTTAGSNADLNDPIAYALRKSGYTVSNLVLVADADVSDVTDGDLDMVLDYAELRTLETVSTNLAQFVDVTDGPISEKMSQYAASLDKRIAKLSDKITILYSTVVEAEAGSLHFDFAAHNDTDVI